MIDIVTVTHNDTNEQQARELEIALRKIEKRPFTFYTHSNREENLGFGKACNVGAFRHGARAEIIGFLNPDVIVRGPFMKTVEQTLSRPHTVITGCRFNKHPRELRDWGVSDWVCGAALFVRRDWFTQVGGFDERYVWSWEETDLIRQAESEGRRVRSIKLPIRHSSPTTDTPKDMAYKSRNFNKGKAAFERKWRDAK